MPAISIVLSFNESTARGSATSDRFAWRSEKLQKRYRDKARRFAA